MCEHTPAPNPDTNWYPIYCEVEDPDCSVTSKAAPIAKQQDPPQRKRAKFPVTCVAAPDIRAAIALATRYGVVRMPDACAETPCTDWK